MSDIQLIDSNIEESMLYDDYNLAALNVLWLRENKKRTILFCSIELYPNEITEITKIKEIPLSIKNVTNCGLYFQRYISSIKEVLEWYKSENHKMIWDERNKDVVTEPKIYIDEPMRLNFNVTNDLPFCVKSRESVRVCSKISPNVNSSIIEYLKQKDVKEWLSQNFIFDLLEYPEYICSINIVAYNPLFRKFDCQIVPSEKGDGILFTLEKRNNVSLNGLKLLYVEKRPAGYSNLKCENIKSNIIFIQGNSPIEEIAYAIFCSERGILAYHNFCSFIKSINLNFNTVEQIKNISVPQRENPSKVEDIYKVSVYHDETLNIPSQNINIGAYQDVMNKLYHEIEFRNQKEKAHYQKIFFDNDNLLEKRAKHFIRELISKATNEVWFIDPYFTTHELFSFAEATTRPNIKVHIVTSTLILNKKVQGSDVKEFSFFQQELSVRNNYDASVMIGKQPIFHDRFIIIDNNVWLSGNSLGTIGERVSYMIKLENPQEFLSTFEIYKKDTNYIQPFEDWIKNKKGENI